MTPAIVVTGFGRCGSSMLMTMLRAGGIPWAPGAQEISGEHHDLQAGIASLAPGMAVKLLDPTDPGWVLPDGLDYLFLWLDRSPQVQARSFSKFLHAFKGVPLASPLERHRLAQTLIDDRAPALAKLTGGPTTVLTYEAALMDPRGFAVDVAFALAKANIYAYTDAMAAAVHRRSPSCAPGLRYEMTGVGP